MSEGLSFYSYVAMGLQEGDKAPGWYNGFNHDSYAKCDNDTEKHKEYSKKTIDKRIELFKSDFDYADEFFTKKIVSEWNNPTYQVFWNIQDKYSNGFNPPSFVIEFLSLKNTFTVQKYLNVFDSIIKFGTLLFILYLMFNKNNELLLLPVTFVGGFLFLTFVSEAKAQYSIMFSILLIPLSVMGYNNIADIFVKKELNIKVNKIYLLFLVAVIIATCINVGNKKYLLKDDDLYYKYVSENGEFDYVNPPEYY